MAYQSLYRRYRSQKFGEILGQPHVTTALRSAVTEGRYGHAYLFSGPRGTGKTSTARVLAKALNCENLGKDGEPCCSCDSCRAIEEGRSFDLHELDAASHNKVDDVRDLISRVQLGSPGRTKVYILDEVHMLSPGAENALLKTLEEPPDHVVFVLATTEPQKVVPTIRSRTQHFEFHLLPAEVLADHVRSVIADAGLDVGDDGIDYALRQGGGSARDTLSALDLVAAAGGVPEGSDAAEALVRAIGDRNPAKAIAAIQDGLELGREPRTIGEDTLELLRNGFLASMGAPLNHLNDRARALSQEVATALGPAKLTRSLEAIGQTLVEMRQAPDPRVPLEVTVLHLCADTGGDALAAMLARIEALEARVAEVESKPRGGRPSAPPTRTEPDKARAPRSPRSPREGRRASDATPEAGASAAAPDRVGSLPSDEGGRQGPGQPIATTAEGSTLTDHEASQALASELDGLSQRVRARFKGGRVVDVDGSTIRFGTPNPIHRDRCDEVKGDVEAALSTHLGRQVTIEVVIDNDSTAPIDPAKLEPSAPKPAEIGAEEDEIGPVAELADADDRGSSGVERITKAFPGSQVVDAPAE